MFSGEYSHPLDSKNRVVFPLPLRDKLTGEQLKSMFLTRGFDGALLLFTKKEWERVAAKVSALPDNRAARCVQRLFLAPAVEVKIDPRTGRMLLPERQRQIARIEKESTVVFLGLGRRVEIWSEQRFREYEAESEPYFADLAEQLFGKGGGSLFGAADTAEREEGGAREEEPGL
jgi:MraZ protein